MKSPSDHGLLHIRTRQGLLTKEEVALVQRRKPTKKKRKQRKKTK